MSESSFWTSQQTFAAFNPRLANEWILRFHQGIESHGPKGLIWLQSSGTESQIRGRKLVALSRDSILHGAQAVNGFLGLSRLDRWANPLPGFHVGGLSISARCFLSGAQEMRWEKPWQARPFYDWLVQTQATWVSLVPTQLYDLCQQNFAVPKALKGVLLGGGALSIDLAIRAQQLGWPLYASYGMTETAAAIAIARPPVLESPPFLQLLSHVQVQIIKPNHICLSGEALFAGYLFFSDGREPRWQPRPEPFLLDDVVEVHEGGRLRVLGRESELVKIMGETVNLANLSGRLTEFLHAPVAILAVPHPRRGAQLFAFIEGAANRHVLADINRQVLPFERLEQLYFVAKMPRNEMGKVQLSELRRQLDSLLSSGP